MHPCVSLGEPTDDSRLFPQRLIHRRACGFTRHAPDRSVVAFFIFLCFPLAFAKEMCYNNKEENHIIPEETKMGFFDRLFGKKSKKTNTSPAVQNTGKPIAPAPQTPEAPKAKSPLAPATNTPTASPAKATDRPANACGQTAPQPAQKPENKGVDTPPVKSAPKAPQPASKAQQPVPKAPQPASKPQQPAPAQSVLQADKAPKGGGRFEIKKSSDGRYVFNLYAANSVIVATSQIYSSAASALNGIKSIIAHAPKAPVEDQTLKNFTPLGYPKWEIYLDKGGQYRFRLDASNGSCICHSQGYTTKANCKNGIDSIIRNAAGATIDKSYLKLKDE